MIGLKATTQGNLVRGKEKKYVLFHRKTWFHRGYMTTTQCAFSLTINIINSVQRRQRQSDKTLRRVLEWALGGTLCLWKNYLCGGTQCCHLHHLTPHDSYTDVQHPIFLLRTPALIPQTGNSEDTHEIIKLHTHTHTNLLLFNFVPLNIQVTALLPTGG